MRCVSALVVIFALAASQPAHAHESPAEAPLFARGSACIERVDKRDGDTLEIPYQVAYDDTVLMMGDIAVADAKTHQFFAFAGSLVASGFDQDFHAFDIESAPARLPLWITIDDVKRAAQASGSVDATGFSASDVPAGAVLDAMPELAGRNLRITADDARVPITMAQAIKGVTWQLEDVPPGLYTLAGYTFSPPFNGWTVRTTKVKVVDAELDVPALHVESLRASLFASQGLRVRGCLDVPEGSELSADFAVDERPEAGYVAWLPARAASSGELELCFHNPRPELTGSVRLRFTLQGPDGARFFYFAPDPITALPGGAACTEVGNVCCDFEGAQGSAGAASAGAGGADATPRDAGVSGVRAGEGAGIGAGVEPTDDGEPAESMRSAASSSGCAVRHDRGAPRASLVAHAWLALLLAAVVTARRRPRTASRSGAPRRRPSTSAC